MKPNMQTQTLWMLLAEFGGRPTVPLTECYHHLGYPSIKKASDAARDLELPVTFYRLEGSQKNVRLIHLTDLAAFIDKRVAEARDEFKKLHNLNPSQKRISENDRSDENSDNNPGVRAAG